MFKNRTFLLLVAVLILAATLRFWGLSRGDMLNDEALYASRAIGLVDYFSWSTQTTPLVWFDPSPPWWTKFSFHDHPPLVFLIQNLFFRIFGENAVAFRLPSVIFGLLSVYLMYLVAVRLFSRPIGLLSAALFAVSVNHIFISRVGMQEAYVIFFMLLGAFYFLKALEDDKFFIHAGIVLGLALITKYTAFILIPVFAVYLLFIKPSLLLSKKLWVGILLTLFIFTPVIIYNIGLYLAAGHFDFQFSMLFGDRPEVWRIAPGKEIGTVTERVQSFIPNLVASNSWAFLALFALSIIGLIFSLTKAPKEALRRHLFLIITFLFVGLLLLLIGPSYRFLTMMTPFMAISGGIFAWAFYQKFLAGRPRVGGALFAVILAFEVFYAFNNQVAYYPRGAEPWFVSKIRYENYNAGYRELGVWFDGELKGKMPGVAPEAGYIFLRRLQEQALEQERERGSEPYPAVIVLYGNFDQGPRMWIFDRLLLYHGWPVIPFGDYAQIIKANGSDFFSKSGVKYFYFVASTNIVFSPEFLTEVKDTMEISIRNKKGDSAFAIYKKEIPSW